MYPLHQPSYESPIYNALVIYKHGPHPRGRAGDSRGNERAFD